ncbi:hypothetical protein ACFL43_04810 [Thermodesulfobacteriota bacterium]
MGFDQREFVRLEASDDAFAALGQGYVRVGKIKDISLGGSSFEYITDLEVQQVSLDEIDIFITGQEFYVAGIPCNIVYDIPMVNSNVFAKPFLTKRCGVKFGVLSEDQITQMHVFLQGHTRGVAPDTFDDLA